MILSINGWLPRFFYHSAVVIKSYWPKSVCEYDGLHEPAYDVSIILSMLEKVLICSGDRLWDILVSTSLV
jgi:hypothetical protein